MSSHRSTPPWPGPARITLALLAAVPAVLAYPWSSARERWLLGGAAVLLVVLLGWWRRLHFTTILGRRAALLRRDGGRRTRARTGADVQTTVLLRVLPSAGKPDALPVALIAGYLNRYGLRAESVQIVSRDAYSGPEAPNRDTWIGLTYSAARNLAALRARSERIPLQETAEVAVRRLADHLRELGWETTGVDAGAVPEIFDAAARETWHALAENDAGYVIGYRVHVDAVLSETLAAVWSQDAEEIWTVVQIAGTDDHRTVAAGCALRTADRPDGASPLPELTPQHGGHRSALRALHPHSGGRLDGHTEVSGDVIATLRWPLTLDGATAGALELSRRHATVG